MENKIWLVWKQYDECSDVHCVCSSKNIAEKESGKLWDRIQNIKTQYYLEFDSDYQKDLDYIKSDAWINEPDHVYDTKMDRVYGYQAKYIELSIIGINIQETEVL